MSLRLDGQRELATELRVLRKSRDLSTRALAGRLGWTQSKVSRIDRGKSMPKPAEVEQWARVLDAPPDEQRRLVALAEAVAIQLTAWRRELAFGRRELQEEIARLEAGASVVRLFGFDVIPGLAQTAAYAEAMFVLGRVELPDQDDLAAIVEARLAQQAVLADRRKQIRLLCTETAFWRGLLGRDEMLEQIDRVLEVAALPNVEFGVIPFSGREGTQTYHAFAVLGEPGADDGAVVLAETVTGGLVIRGEMDIRLYIAHFHQLWLSATLDLRELLREVAAKAPWR